MSYLQSNEHTCQYNRTRTRTNKQSVSADPMHDELLISEQDPIHMTNYYLSQPKFPTLLPNQCSVVVKCPPLNRILSTDANRWRTTCALHQPGFVGFPVSTNNLALLASGMGNTLPGPTRQCHRCRLPVDTRGKCGKKQIRGIRPQSSIELYWKLYTESDEREGSPPGIITPTTTEPNESSKP